MLQHLHKTINRLPPPPILIIITTKWQFCKYLFARFGAQWLARSGGGGDPTPPHHHSHLFGRPSARPQQQHQRGFWPSPQSTIRVAKASSFEISTMNVVKIFCAIKIYVMGPLHSNIRCIFVQCWSIWSETFCQDRWTFRPVWRRRRQEIRELHCLL